MKNLRKDVRKAWKWCEEAYEDALKELNAQMKDLEHALKKAKRMRFAAEQRRDQALSEVAGLRRENSELKDQLEKTEGQNKKLLAQLNRDYENSSIPSSQSRNRRKIPTIVNALEENPERSRGTPIMEGKSRKQLRLYICLRPKLWQRIRISKKQRRS